MEIGFILYFLVFLGEKYWIVQINYYSIIIKNCGFKLSWLLPYQNILVVTVADVILNLFSFSFVKHKIGLTN